MTQPATLQTLTTAQSEALAFARRNGGFVSAGTTSERGCVVRINARTIDALARKGLVTLCLSNEGGMAARVVETECGAR